MVDLRRLERAVEETVLNAYEQWIWTTIDTFDPRDVFQEIMTRHIEPLLAEARREGARSAKRAGYEQAVADAAKIASRESKLFGIAVRIENRIRSLPLPNGDPE